MTFLQSNHCFKLSTPLIEKTDLFLPEFIDEYQASIRYIGECNEYVTNHIAELKHEDWVDIKLSEFGVSKKPMPPTLSHAEKFNVLKELAFSKSAFRIQCQKAEAFIWSMYRTKTLGTNLNLYTAGIGSAIAKSQKCSNQCSKYARYVWELGTTIFSLIGDKTKKDTVFPYHHVFRMPVFYDCMINLGNSIPIVAEATPEAAEFERHLCVSPRIAIDSEWDMSLFYEYSEPSDVKLYFTEYYLRFYDTMLPAIDLNILSTILDFVFSADNNYRLTTGQPRQQRKTYESLTEEEAETAADLIVIPEKYKRNYKIFVIMLIDNHLAYLRIQ
jgi:hypothetical protein